MAILQEEHGYAALIHIDNSDLNLDGEITQADNQILSRHLAGWSDYATLPRLSGSGRLGVKSDTNGGALYETPWDRFVENYPTDSKPYIIRNFLSGLYDYTNSDGTDVEAYRGVLKY